MERGNSFDSIDGRRIDAQASLKPIILSKLLDSVKQVRQKNFSKFDPNRKVFYLSVPIGFRRKKRISHRGRQSRRFFAFTIRNRFNARN